MKHIKDKEVDFYLLIHRANNEIKDNSALRHTTKRLKQRLTDENYKTFSELIEEFSQSTLKK